MKCLITMPSRTYAEKLRRVADNIGIGAEIIRIPSDLSGEGCGYAIIVDENECQRLLGRATENSIPVRRVYSFEI